jgi:hypothetical protein
LIEPYTVSGFAAAMKNSVTTHCPGKRAVV